MNHAVVHTNSTEANNGAPSQIKVARTKKTRNVWPASLKASLAQCMEFGYLTVTVGVCIEMIMFYDPIICTYALSLLLQCWIHIHI